MKRSHQVTHNKNNSLIFKSYLIMKMRFSKRLKSLFSMRMNASLGSITSSGINYGAS